MSDKETMIALLESQALDRVADYINRGRAFQSLSIDEVNARWIASFRAWLANFGKSFDHTERGDLESELRIRQTEPPFQLVKHELDALLANSEALDEKISKNPARLLEMEHSLQEQLDEFEQKRKPKCLSFLTSRARGL
jgi:hypothetical protein